MYNEEMYQKLVVEFGEANMSTVCEIISSLYDIKFNAAKTEDGFTEFDYERDWWINKHIEITSKTEQEC